jgi:hypothetical protein
VGGRLDDFQHELTPLVADGTDFYSVSPDTFNWGYTYTNNHLGFTTPYVGGPDVADAGKDVIYAGDAANDFEWRMAA